MSDGLSKAKFFQFIRILSKLNMILKHPVSRLFKILVLSKCHGVKVTSSCTQVGYTVPLSSSQFYILWQFGSHIMSTLSDLVTSSFIHDSLNDTQINHHKPWFCK